MNQFRIQDGRFLGVCCLSQACAPSRSRCQLLIRGSVYTLMVAVLLACGVRGDPEPPEAPPLLRSHKEVDEGATYFSQPRQLPDGLTSDEIEDQ